MSLLDVDRILLKGSVGKRSARSTRRITLDGWELQEIQQGALWFYDTNRKTRIKDPCWGRKNPWEIGLSNMELDESKTYMLYYENGMYWLEEIDPD